MYKWGLVENDKCDCAGEVQDLFEISYFDDFGRVPFFFLDQLVIDSEFSLSSFQYHF